MRINRPRMPMLFKRQQSLVYPELRASMVGVSAGRAMLFTCVAPLKGFDLITLQSSRLCL